MLTNAADFVAETQPKEKVDSCFIKTLTQMVTPFLNLKDLLLVTLSESPMTKHPPKRRSGQAHRLHPARRVSRAVSERQLCDLRVELSHLGPSTRWTPVRGRFRGVRRPQSNGWGKDIHPEDDPMEPEIHWLVEENRASRGPLLGSMFVFGSVAVQRCRVKRVLLRTKNK